LGDLADVGASALYRTAAKESVRFIILSHSFREEGITPLAWNYMDARYTRALIKRFCSIPLVHFKNVDIHHMIYWSLVKGIRIVNITNYYDDTGDKIEKRLADRFLDSAVKIGFYVLSSGCRGPCGRNGQENQSPCG